MDTIHKFDKIRRINKDEGATFADNELVYVEEKVDGANFRVWVDDTGLRFGTRNTVFPLETDDAFDGYGAFNRAVEYIKSLKTQFHEDYIYYFEAMIKHTINYDFDKHPAAILFDIYCISQDRYLPRNILEGYSDEIQMSKIIFEGKFGDFNQEVPQSVLYDGQAEGFVIKPLLDSRDKHGNIHRAKVVGEKFREEKREVWGSCEDKETAFAMKYATQGRIDKMIAKLETAKNEKVHPSWIPILTYNITEDICTEEFKKLLKIGTPNLKTIRSEVQRQVKLRLGQLGVL
jgi:hypothetical protein